MDGHDKSERFCRCEIRRKISPDLSPGEELIGVDGED